MLELSNVENKVDLKCQITGYQFPDSKRDDWCLLKVEVKQGEQYFERIDPAIETTELERLYDWLKCLSERRLPRFARLSFTEPCISFEFLACADDSIRISINLSHELKPEFELSQFGFRNNDWKIVFNLDDENISKILENLRRTLKLFPVRGKS